MGSVTENVLPLPRLLSNAMLPPSKSVSALQMESPMPQPSLVLVREVSTCRKRSKMTIFFSSGIPSPLSITVMITFWASALKSTWMEPPAEVCFMALDRRFSRILSSIRLSVDRNSSSILREKCSVSPFCLA